MPISPARLREHQFKVRETLRKEMQKVLDTYADPSIKRPPQVMPPKSFQDITDFFLLFRRELRIQIEPRDTP